MSSTTDSSKITWNKIKSLGKGGQGEVFLVQNAQAINNILKNIKQGITGANAAIFKSEQDKNAKLLLDSISDYLYLQKTDNIGAMKELHNMGDEKAKKRLKNEVEALTQINNPNVIRLLDHNVDEGWYALFVVKEFT